jgi:hypothetical protein
LLARPRGPENVWTGPGDEQAVNLKRMLYIFESMFGLKINFEKSEVMMVLEDDAKAQDFAALFNCQQGVWPIKYLGTPVCARRPTVAEMGFLGEKTKKKMSGWVGNSMSIGERVVKIDVCLSSIDVLVYEIFHTSGPFSGLGVLIKRNIILLNGNGSVNPRKKGFGFEESIQV